MKYDVFISYRREGGYDTAKHLYDLLVRDGYRVSFDIDTLQSGDFDTQLYERIDQCKDFILIVDKNAFTRTLDPSFDSKKDWLRCELAYALKKQKNIIPIFLSGETAFPNNLPKDIAEVTKKNGPEYNRYHFNSFYEVLKKRFFHKKSNKKLLLGMLLALMCLVAVFYSIHNDSIVLNPSSVKNTTNTEQSTSYQLEQTKRQDAMKAYCGYFSIVELGLMKEGITWVYNMDLDPVNSNCEYVEEGIVNITNSKGWCGTLIQGTEFWEIYSFILHNSLKYAIAEMRQVDEFYEGENHVCKVKLELDDYNNIKMSYIDGNDAPAPLYDGSGGFSNIAIFIREK